MPKLNEVQIEIVTKTAVQAALDYLETDRQNQEKVKRDRRLRNTRLLLRNYRSFKVHSAYIRQELDKLNDPAALEELDSNELAVEAIKRSKERTLAMVNYIDQMLEVYRVLSEKSDKPEDKRRYQAIYQMYISEEKYSAEKIATCQNTNVRTVYRDVKEAIKTLTALIFGVDGIRFID